MKSFFSSFFASFAALVIFFIGGAFLMIVGLIALAAMGEKPVAVEKGSYLVLDLSAAIQDTPDQMEGFEDFAEALGSGHKVLQTRAVVRALQAAAQDPDIAGLYICGDPQPMGYSSGYAALKEVREAIVAFKASGKPVKAYLSYASTRAFYVASVAGDLTLDPYGGIAMPGLASQPMFFTGAFEKFGVGVQVTRVGKYKSAVEPYTRKDMSPENRQQTQQLLDDVWAELVAGIEQARGLKAGEFQQAVDTEGVLRAESALRHKLVDRVAYYDSVLDELRAATGRKEGSRTFKQIAIRNYSRLVSSQGLSGRRRDEGKVELGGKGRVAIVYAEGAIVDGTGNEDGYVYGDKLAREIRRLRQDSSVKAIVLRVNSPGGSASASETILRELQLARKDKVVVVSMGTVAASGGYWIATAGDRIFAEPSTITGSIGVFGMFLNLQGLTQDKLGLTFDTVKTGRFADLMTITRPKTEAELAIFQGMVDWIYGEFIHKVAEARKLEPAVVQEIAQGRVWSGRAAEKLKLVDELGGLDAAVAYAAKKTDLGENARISEYPRRKQLGEALSEAFDPRRRDQASAGPLGAFLREATAQLKVLQSFNDPRGLYARLPVELTLP